LEHNNREGAHDLKAQLDICPNPIFIIGSPRSATTALARALAEHSHLWTSSESQILWDLFADGNLNKNYKRAQSGSGGSWLVDQGVEKADFLAFLGFGINGLFTRQSKGLRWMDHTPHYTFLTEDFVKMFPGSSFLHMLRDGRRVVHSMINYRTPNAQPNERGEDWSKDFAVACRTWARYVECALDFCEKHPWCSLTVINEELIADPSTGFERILRFLGEPGEDGPANYFRVHRTNSSFPANSPHMNSKPWEAWTVEQNEIFLKEAGKAMELASSANSRRKNR
jgi:hypothetical protein